MTTQLDYQTPQPTLHSPWFQARWLTAIMMMAGCSALVFGGALAFFAAVQLEQSQTNPNFSWGPGAYVFNMLEGFVYMALVLVPTGIVLVMVAARRLRARRGA